MRYNFPIDEIQRITGYDPWFLGEIEDIIHTEQRIARDGLPTDAKGMRKLKAMGFSDLRLAKLTAQKEATVIAVSADSVYLDIGYKTEGVLPLAPFPHVEAWLSRAPKRAARDYAAAHGLRVDNGV